MRSFNGILRFPRVVKLNLEVNALPNNTWGRGQMVLWASATWAVCVLIAVILSTALGPKPEPGDFHRDDQCELLHPDSSVMEPENTWSNVGYLYAGLLIVFVNIKSNRYLNLIFGFSLVALAWLSGLYHAEPVSDTYRHLDVSTIYWVLPLLITYALYGILVYRPSGATLSTTTIIGFTVLIVAMGTFLAFTSVIDSTVLTMLLVLALVVIVGIVMLWLKLPKPLWDIEKVWYTTILGILLIGSGIFRLFDGTGTFLGIQKFGCLPHNPLQFHALWHLFSAATLLAGYNFFSRAFGDEGTVFPD
jgi:hypothetical protein